MIRCCEVGAGARVDRGGAARARARIPRCVPSDGPVVAGARAPGRAGSGFRRAGRPTGFPDVDAVPARASRGGGAARCVGGTWTAGGGERLRGHRGVAAGGSAVRTILALGAARRVRLAIPTRHPDPSGVRTLACVPRRVAVRGSPRTPSALRPPTSVRFLRRAPVPVGVSGRRVRSDAGGNPGRLRRRRVRRPRRVAGWCRMPRARLSGPACLPRRDSPRLPRRPTTLPHGRLPPRQERGRVRFVNFSPQRGKS